MVNMILMQLLPLSHCCIVGKGAQDNYLYLVAGFKQAAINREQVKRINRKLGNQ